MCYNYCPHFRFNPMTGEDRCTLKKGEQCPEEIEDDEE